MLPRLYPILDVDIAAKHGWEITALARACLGGGARLLQLRAKRLASGAFLDLATGLVREATPYGARVIVNDRADVAALAGAAGVHVGQEDLSAADARRLLTAAALVGLSTHAAAEIDAAGSEPIDYLAVGPVFGTSSKETPHAAVGLSLVRYAAARARVPVVAIGGITLATAPDVIAAGAASVAVISDLLATGDPGARVREYLAALGNPEP